MTVQFLFSWSVAFISSHTQHVRTICCPSPPFSFQHLRTAAVQAFTLPSVSLLEAVAEAPSSFTPKGRSRLPCPASAAARELFPSSLRQLYSQLQVIPIPRAAKADFDAVRCLCHCRMLTNFQQATNIVILLMAVALLELSLFPS